MVLLLLLFQLEQLADGRDCSIPGVGAVLFTKLYSFSLFTKSPETSVKPIKPDLFKKETNLLKL